MIDADVPHELFKSDTKTLDDGNETLYVFSDDSKYSRLHEVPRPCFLLSAMRQSAHVFRPSDY